MTLQDSSFLQLMKTAITDLKLPALFSGQNTCKRVFKGALMLYTFEFKIQTMQQLHVKRILSFLLIFSISSEKSCET